MISHFSAIAPAAAQESGDEVVNLPTPADQPGRSTQGIPVGTRCSETRMDTIRGHSPSILGSLFNAWIQRRETVRFRGKVRVYKQSTRNIDLPLVLVNIKSYYI